MGCLQRNMTGLVREPIFGVVPELSDITVKIKFYSLARFLQLKSQIFASSWVIPLLSVFRYGGSLESGDEEKKDFSHR